MGIYNGYKDSFRQVDKFHRRGYILIGLFLSVLSTAVMCGVLSQEVDRTKNLAEYRARTGLIVMDGIVMISSIIATAIMATFL